MKSNGFQQNNGGKRILSCNSERYEKSDEELKEQKAPGLDGKMLNYRESNIQREIATFFEKIINTGIISQ
jgi:hypothetical protein